MYFASLLLIYSSLTTLCFAQSPLTSACTAQQYNDIAGFPNSKSACYPTNYYQTSDLGQTNPDDARQRCQQQCTSMGSSCKSVVAQLNKAADSNLYSGTCFLYRPGQVVTPRGCADTAYMLQGYMKDDTNACFSSSRVAASSFCSSYLHVPLITKTATSTPPATTVTTTIVTSSTTTSTVIVTTTPTVTASVTVTITTTVSTNTVTTSTVETLTSVVSTTTTTTVLVQTTNFPVAKRQESPRRRAVSSVPPPACVTPDTPVSRLSAACSCLSVSTSTTTTTTTLPRLTNTVTSTTTSSVTSTRSVTVTAPATTLTITSTSTSSVVAITTTTSTSTFTTTSTTTYTSTTTKQVPQCAGTPVTNGFFSFTYNTYCNTQCNTGGVINNVLSSGVTSDFNGCISFCGNRATIAVVNYNEGTGECICVFTADNSRVGGKPGFDCAVRQGSGVDGA